MQIEDNTKKIVFFIVEMQLTLSKGNTNRRQQKRIAFFFTVEMQLTLFKGNTNRRQYKKILKKNVSLLSLNKKELPLHFKIGL